MENVIMNFNEKTKKIEALIKSMKIPAFRKTIKNKTNLRWLNRNMQIKNADHPNFKAVKALLKEIL